jgi:hypothetical protein
MHATTAEKHLKNSKPAWAKSVQYGSASSSMPQVGKHGNNGFGIQVSIFCYQHF